MNNNSIRIFSEKYENKTTGENVDGVTIIIDGKFRQILDVIMHTKGKYNNYTEVTSDILFSGINSFISKYQ